MVVAIEARFAQQGIAEASQLEDVLIALARTDVGPKALLRRSRRLPLLQTNVSYWGGSPRATDP